MFAGVTLSIKPSDSILFIVRTLTELLSASNCMLQPSAVRAIFICSTVNIDKHPVWHYLCNMDNISTNIETVFCHLSGAYAPNTLRSYYADTKSFVDWCDTLGIEPFPLTSAAMCSFIENMQLAYSYSTIRRRISALRRVNKLMGFEDLTHTDEVYLSIRKLKRSKGLEQRQAVGINHDILIKMIDAQPNTLAGTRNRALLSLGYDFLARRSELVAMKCDDLTFTLDGGLKGIIRKSKTDQYGRGRLVFGSDRSAKLVKKWLKLKPQQIQYLFCAINHNQCLDRAMCDRSVNEIIKRSIVRVKRCERPSDVDVSGHSLRVGAAQDLLTKGFDLAAIMRAGGWSNPNTVSRYLKFTQHNIWQ